MEGVFFSFGWGNKQEYLQESFTEQSDGSSRGDGAFNEMCIFTCKNALRMHMLGNKQRAENLSDQQVYD